MDSICCSYNTLQLNIGDRSWGQKSISIEYVLNIEVFKIKMNHLIIFCGQAAAQHSALPGGKALISVHHVPTASSATSSTLCGFCSLEAGTQARSWFPLCQQRCVQGWDNQCLDSGNLLLRLCSELTLRNALLPAVIRPNRSFMTMLQKLENYCLRANSDCSTKILFTHTHTHTHNGCCREWL